MEIESKEQVEISDKFPKTNVIPPKNTKNFSKEKLIRAPEAEVVSKGEHGITHNFPKTNVIPHENDFFTKPNLESENKEKFRISPIVQLEDNVSKEKVEFIADFPETNVIPHENTFFTKPIPGSGEKFNLPTVKSEDITVESNSLQIFRGKEHDFSTSTTAKVILSFE